MISLRFPLLLTLASVASVLTAPGQDRPAASTPAVSADTVAAQRPAYAAAEAAKHVGEDAVVTGSVAAVSVSKQGNTYLNFGAPFPNHVFSGSVHGVDAAKFGDLKQFQGKTVAVTGKIELYNGKPQIVLNSPDQIKVVEAAATTPVKP